VQNKNNATQIMQHHTNSSPHSEPLMLPQWLRASTSCAACLICNPKSLAVSLPCCATFEAAQQVCLTALLRARRAIFILPL